MPEINGIPIKSKVLVFLEEYSMWRFAGNAVFLEEYSMWRSAGNEGGQASVRSAKTAQIGRHPCHFFLRTGSGRQRNQGISRKSPAYLNLPEIYKIAFKS